MSEFDFIIVGGGIAGCVIAHRLHERQPELKVLLIEAGKDVSQRTDILQKPFPLFLETEIDWSYDMAPQKHLGGSKIKLNAGKALGGGSALNACAWMRGDRQDYDAWAQIVDDERWSWDGLLPYFRRTEHHFEDKDTEPPIHGHDGPVYISSTAKFPLHETVRRAWDSMGLSQLKDINNGSPIGYGNVVYNRREGNRQVTPKTYPLDGVQVMTETLAKRVIVERGSPARATGVELANGTVIKASREVIVCSGAIGTPQLLFLSGIGSPEELQRLGIETIVPLEDVGKNFFDHPVVMQYWKLRDPSSGLAVGHPLFPEILRGNAAEFVATQSPPHEPFQAAMAQDSYAPSHMLRDEIASIQSILVYAAANPSNPTIPMDGSHIYSAIGLTQPTSRGSITLSDTNPATPPMVDPNFYATNADRFALRWAIRRMAQMMHETDPGKEMILEETTAKDITPMSSKSTDEEIDELVKHSIISFKHPGGSASMGKVVDTEFKVFNTQGLRIVDGSVLPISMGCPPQALIYAMGEKAADLILS